jgi:hypothetical protein
MAGHASNRSSPRATSGTHGERRVPARCVHPHPLNGHAVTMCTPQVVHYVSEEDAEACHLPRQTSVKGPASAEDLADPGLALRDAQVGQVRSQLAGGAVAAGSAGQRVKAGAPEDRGGRKVGGQGYPVRGLRRGAGELVMDFLVGDRRAEHAGQDGLGDGGDSLPGAGGAVQVPPAVPPAAEAGLWGPAEPGLGWLPGEADADVGDDGAVLSDEHRVEVEFGDLGDVLHHGADPVQQLGEGRHVQRRGLAVSGEQPVGPQ